MMMCNLPALFFVQWGIIGAITFHKASEGGNITVGCQFYLGGSKKTFCRNGCHQDDILVETTGNTEHKGRYSIKYEPNSFLKSDLMYVSITNVTSSDSGQYQCVLNRWLKDGSNTFRIEVTNDASSLNPTYTLKPAESPPNCTANSSTTELLSSTVSPKITLSSQNQKYTTTRHSPSTSGGTLLYVGVSLVAIVILLTAALAMFHWNKRTNEPNEPPASMEYAQIPEANRLYEEIPQPNRQSGSVEISTVYCSASYPHDQIYSLADAPSNRP